MPQALQGIGLAQAISDLAMDWQCFCQVLCSLDLIVGEIVYICDRLQDRCFPAFFLKFAIDLERSLQINERPVRYFLSL
jgi:hypothetical protein